MKITKGPIGDVVISNFRKAIDERGWLTEIFRHDDLPEEYHPAMCYVSVTLPGVLRGPPDLFAWVGPGDFKVSLWDNRPESPTYGNRMEFFMGANNPGSAIIPKGVVHCYRCISADPGFVINCPNRLYAGDGKLSPVDEIRHEDDPENPFVKDERTRRVHLR